MEEACRAYVESAVRQGLNESPWEKVIGQAVLGGARFVQELKSALRGNRREQPGARAMESRVSVAGVIAAVEKVKEEPWKEFRDRYGDWGRDMVLYLGRRRCGLSLKELGAAAGGMDYMSVSIAIHRFGRRLASRLALRQALSECQTTLAEM